MQRHLTHPQQGFATQAHALRERLQEELLGHIYSPRARESAQETDQTLMQGGSLRALASRTDARGLNRESKAQQEGGTPHVDAHIALG